LPEVAAEVEETHQTFEVGVVEVPVGIERQQVIQ
jgi:hypothetical protein